jgi:hypothetical protein
MEWNWRSLRVTAVSVLSGESEKTREIRKHRERV